MSSSSTAFPPASARRHRIVARIVLAAFLATLPGAPTLAEVTGEQVLAGDAAFDRNGDVTTIHASDGAIIEYDQFNVWSNEELHFVQPHAQARVLNRVLGDVTHIEGGLFANGIVYIVNPAGIFFGSEAVVDVGGLYAAGGDMTNEDFLAGVDQFELTGTVENAGRIEAFSVALLGTAVANHGEIHAPDGTIAFVAGDRVLLSRLGGHLHVEVEGGAGEDGFAIEQTGSVDAGSGSVSFTTGDVYSLALNHEGITRGTDIEVRAESGLVQVAGVLDASDASAGATGGDIAVTGGQVALLGATLDASGDTGGGKIRVGGDLRGAGALPNAKRTFVDAGTVLRADAKRDGHGGTVIVYADEATAFHGAISARGGEAGGDGGFAEISGAVFLFTDGDVDLRAAHGETGTLLYDPQDIVLRGGSADGDDAPDASATDLIHDPNAPGTLLFADADMLAAPFEIFESEIEGTNANIVLEATNSITADAAASFINDGGEGAGVLRIVDGNSLTLRTRNDPGDEVGGAATNGIDLNTLALETSGGGGVTLETGTGTEADNLGGAITVGDVTTGGANASVMDADGDVLIVAGGDGSVTTGAIVTTGQDDAAGPGEDGGNVTVSTGNGAITVASVDASGGDTTSGDAMHAAGDAGNIAILANDDDEDAMADSDVDIAGDLTALGGSAVGGGTGDGGSGGFITVRSDGVDGIDISPDPDTTVDRLITLGGGALTVNGAVDASGGTGGAQGSGGRGGSVRVQADDGAITVVGDITTSGGAGGVDGGDAGRIDSSTSDANQSAETLDDNDLVLGNLVARGGVGTTGSGGAGGNLQIDTQRSAIVRELGNPENVIQEALGGGDVVIASIDTSGADGATSGGRGGSANVSARGEDRAVQIAGGVQTVGGNGGTDPNGFGGAGGSVSFQTDDGDVDISTIDTSGGDTMSVNPAEGTFGASAGGGGRVEVVARDADADYGTDIMIGDITASGGDAAADEGTGGRGGVVIVRTEGVTTPIEPDPGVPTTIVPVLGGGTIAVGNIVATGGTGGGGGIGGGAEIGTNLNAARVSDAPITVGDIDASGGSGDRFGGATGAIRVQSRDADAGDDNDIVLGSVTVEGGASGAGGGGNGGSVDIRAFARLLISEIGNPDNVIQTDIGGGSVTVNRVSTGGGDGATFGGDAGSTTLVASGAAQAITINTQILSDGGDGANGNGGGGGRVELAQRETDLILDYLIDASGGDGVTPDDNGVGGAGGTVVLNSGLQPDDGPGDVRIEVMPDQRRGTNGSAAPFSRASGTLAVLSSGRTIFDVGPVELHGDVVLFADGGFDVLGSLDTHVDADREVVFEATVEGGASSFGGDIGANRALERVAVEAAEDAVDPTLAFAGASVTTTGDQIFDPDATVAGDSTFAAEGRIEFGGDLDGLAPGANVDVDASDTAQFGGNVGANTALAGLDVDAGAGIGFTDDAGQTIITDGPAGIRLNADIALPSAPSTATIGALGDLRLESTGGDVIFGDNQKASAAGRLDLIGNTVRFTDLSGLDISVQATTAQVFSRDVGLVKFPSGSLVTDGGTDIIGNTVSFSTPLTVVGSGPEPRIATQSGAATNTGGLRVARLQGPVTLDQIVTAQGEVLDLAIPAPDPGNETPELEGGPVDVPLGLYPSQEEAGPGSRVSPAEVVAWLSCSPDAGAALAGCVPPAKPAYGSALDTERAAEVAEEWRRLLGDAKPAKAGRASLALASRDPGAELAGRSTSPAGRAYLEDVARLLGRTRMLGLDPATFAEVSDAMITRIVARIGAPNLDAERLRAGIEAYSMGMLAGR